MSPIRSPAFLADLVRELCRLPTETESVEFKRNNDDPQELGEYISALANAAALVGKSSAYLLWGVDDKTHDIVGTTVAPKQQKKGAQELESWLLQQLTPKIEFGFYEVDVDGKRVVVLEIERATRQPVQFHGVEYIRVGSYKQPLKNYPEKERALWRIFDQTPFEVGVATEHVTEEEVVHLLDYPAYFDLLARPLPTDRSKIIEALAGDRLIRRSDAGGWDITNLGAMLFAKQLAWFHKLERKAIRVIVYRGTEKTSTEREQGGSRGYASGFEGLITYINGLIPSNEVVEQALRKTVPMYPPIAVRELVANALIHQDFFVSGAGPTVEIFADRMEITNPGVPLVKADRFLDQPPRSRNEDLASLMRRMGICEERGSGVDKVVFQTEYFQLPAPLFEVRGEATVAILYAHRPLDKMSRDDRVRACYLHACLKYVSNEQVTNASIRKRFGIDEKNSASASRLIKEAVEAGVIVAVDPAAGRKFMRYVPSWAVAS
ncbi:MAG: putative DNA binding domain-containing protein [Myxococcales bacterium]|nr:putative DNA binding domain-containing protein [Myxococcales bacterium]